MELHSPGLGTFKNTDFEVCSRTVSTALEMGYRHIDTAVRYHNEEAVGAGIRSADVPREAVQVATKVLHPRINDSDDRESIMESVHGSLDRLGLEYIDLLYIHWADDYDLEAAFSAFEELRADGVVGNIGVANFTIDLLEESLELCPSICCNQVEMHPLLQQHELRTYCDAHDIDIIAYAPLIQGGVGDVPELQTVAEKHGTSAARVSLAWLREMGGIPIPKATSTSHLQENLAEAPGSEERTSLDAEDLSRIEGIDREERRVHPPFAPDGW